MLLTPTSSPTTPIPRARKTRAGTYAFSTAGRMYNAPCAALLHSAKGRIVSGFHMWLGIGVLASNSVAAVWGAVAWLRKRPSIGFWPLLRVAQGFVIVQVLVGLGLVASGERAP